MQRIAGVWLFALPVFILPGLALPGLALPGLANAQIITAQPARSIQAAPYSAGPPAPFNPRYATTAAYSSPSGSSTSASASLLQSPEANTIRGWYRDYLGRDVGQDLTALANLLRGGMSPTDLQATILGSDEFYWQKGRDPQTFVRETLQAVTWSEPTYAEVRRWTDRLTQLRNDRFALVREILLDVNHTPEQNDQWRDVVVRLPAAARLAIDTINFEIGGTTQGRQANLQAVALLDTANRLEQLAGSGAPQATEANAAVAAAERSLSALQSTLSNPPGTAPSAAGVVRRIGTMLAEARAALTTTDPPTRPTYPTPGTPPVGTPGYSEWQIAEPLAAARRAAESLIQTLTSQAYQDYSYNIVLRDLDTLASRLAALESLSRSGVTQQRLAWEVQSIVDSAERAGVNLGTSRLPYLARMYWQSLQSSVAQLRELTGVQAGSSSTTLLRPSDWHESLLPLLDQAAAQIDVFLAGTTPLVYGILEVPSVQADARSLKSRVLVMRQQAGQGQAAGVLKQTLSGMVGDYQAAFDRWNRIVATSRITAPARLSPVGETLNRVEQIINDAPAGGEVTPATSSRLSQELAQLSGEVTDARRALTGISGYREQQAIDLYLEQIAGYVQQIGDAALRQTPAEQRRLAVGMQSVVGNLQTEADSLSRRVAGIASVRQQASDLQLRTDRIGRLVDEIEAELY
jgi:hypothetical protein